MSWYNEKVMEKIERWRVEELSLLLSWLACLLKEGFNPEWASVFSHFDEESRRLLAAGPVDCPRLKRLVGNIKACFVPPSSFPSLRLEAATPGEVDDLSVEFLGVKGRLRQALEEMEARLVDYIN